MNHRTLATCALHISLSARYRSINSEILYCLNKALNPKTINSEKIIAYVEEMQAKYKLTPLTEQILTNSKNSGRE